MKTTSTRRSMLWSVGGQGGVQLLRLATTLALAALLEPGEFGLMAMVWVVTGIAEMFIDLGSGQALIQRKALDERLTSSVFWANVGFATLLGAIVVGLSGELAAVFAEPRVAELVVTIAPVLIAAAVGVVPCALLQRGMRFDVVARARMAGALAAAGVGIGFAVAGAGVWAMVWGHYAAALTTSALLIGGARFWPRATLDLHALRGVAGFSLNLLGTNLSNFVVSQVDTILVGRFFGRDVLGCYALAKKIVLQPIVAAGGSVVNVLFARFARLSTHASIGPPYVAASGAVASLLLPVAVGMACVAEPLLIALRKPDAGPAWDLVAPLIGLLAPAAIAGTISLPTGAVFRAVGRTDILFGIGLLRGALVVTGSLVGAHLDGVGGAAFGLSCGMVLAVLPGLMAAHRLVGVQMTELLRVLRPTTVALCALLAVELVVLRVARPSEPPSFGLGLGLLPAGLLILAGVVSYGVALWAQKAALLRAWLPQSRPLPASISASAPIPVESAL